jgi:hypothetical protein
MDSLLNFVLLLCVCVFFCVLFSSSSWPVLAAAKSVAVAEEWEGRVVSTQLFNVWRELISPERQCCAYKTNREAQARCQ